jgi:hypothetical protein
LTDAARTGASRAGPRSRARVLLVASAVQLPLVALWLAFGAGLAVITSRIVDWYVMTDELLYERLAMSIARSGSPLPRVHGELISNVNQLYPLLLAPVYRHNLVPAALHDAHILNAFVMSSASIPAFLLARRVTQSRRLAYAVAIFAVCVPWVVLSSFLLTEVVAYPVFLWTVLALQRAAVSPRPRNDLLVLVALSLAILARTQFAILLAVVPVAFFVHVLVFAHDRSASMPTQIRSALRELVSQHRLLTGAYALLAIGGVALAAVGRLSGVLGTYSVTVEGDLVPSGMPSSLLEHLAKLGLGLGILPFVVGAAWLLTAIVNAKTREQHAFASIATVTVVALLFEVTSYDLRFGAGAIHDRYLFYAAPLILIGVAAARSGGRWPTWSALVPAVLLALGFAFVSVRRYDKLNVDSPVSVLNDGLRDLGGSVNGARVLLALGTLVVTVLFVEACLLLRRQQLATLLVGAGLLAVPVETGLAFSQLLSADGTSGRPITLDQGVVFDWIDRTLGPDAKVTMVPYPVLRGDYWANGGYWWNVEFWNASVKRAVVYRGGLSWTPETFPTTPLRFDPATGRANVSPSDYIAQADRETRFHIAGTAKAEYRGILLSIAAKPWRTAWMTFGLYDDGWTQPDTVARIRVFARPGDTEATTRYLTISARTPADIEKRSFRLSSNLKDTRGQAVRKGVVTQIAVCVPAHGFADVRLSSRGYSPIYGDPQSATLFTSYARSGGVYLTQIALADETGPC